MSERVLNLRSTHNAQAARILAPVYILTVNLNQFHVWSQKHLFHLLIESSRFTLTSLWIILHFPGENFFLKQSSSRVTGYVFKGLIKIWEIWINRWLSVLNLCSKAILCAKIAQKYKNSKRQKLLRSCRAQPWAHDRPIDGLHNISLQCGLSHRSLPCIPESGAKHFFISPYDIIFWPHELKDMYNIFFRAKRLDLQATKKKKPEMGKISESHL